MATDDSQQIRVTEGVNYLSAKSLHTEPRSNRLQALRILSLAQITMNQKHITSRGMTHS